MTGAAIQGIEVIAVTGARQILSRTPASMAEAIGWGMAAMRRASGGRKPAATISRPQSRNAPTAAPKLGEGVVRSRAAPGVDQAMVIGRRWRRPRRMATTPTETQRASSPEAAWSDEAPTARRPASTTVKELAKPTRPVTTPAMMGLDKRSINGTVVLRLPRPQDGRP